MPLLEHGCSIGGEERNIGRFEESAEALEPGGVHKVVEGHYSLHAMPVEQP